MSHVFLFFVMISAFVVTRGFAHTSGHKDHFTEIAGCGESPRNVSPDSAGAATADSAAVYPQALGFELQDQYGITRNCVFPSAKIRIITFADQKGTTSIEGWVRPIYKRYGNQIDITGVAVLSAVPAIARALVSAFIRASVKYPVLLDWEGRVSAQLGYENHTFRLVVVDCEGGIRHSLTGPVNSSELQRLFAQIDALLREQPVLTSNQE